MQSLDLHPRPQDIQEQRPHATQKPPPIMLRRPPTIISLTENDLQFHLERIFARSNPPNIDELSLEDADQNYTEQRSSEDQQPSTDKSAERLDNHRHFCGSNAGSSCMTRSSSMAAQTHSAGLPASMMNGSTHRTIVDPNRAATAATTTAQLISSNLPQARASRLREPSPSHHRTELTIPPQEFLDRHILPSPDGKKGPSAVPEHKSLKSDDRSYHSMRHNVTNQALAQKIAVAEARMSRDFPSPSLPSCHPVPSQI